ncbi:NAD(P)-dependent dehydrogenase, short-chain alcohol dehydrogenase family [Rubritalea squalenifaciens DSM 18772]|uniref:NAD(P)-dependent dehydrogenase, short-chain alcohol dehydrogenase family n=1 Tax=Rubritalea squalenifaciens DSM 18772 TaxID=1123071 RepID=A0A1M6P1J6_9BACT|nr:SDR family oxidoreductase [Rubritalea squalenifaciens]SHK01784.1 NAD(P)-dependent dehydrogenase, short-chain alcohol dehydrogenase family [Rubritalea squalenifaciens DSM 18772]
MTHLIIGGNSGIGKEIAAQLSQQGHDILTACRNPTDYQHQTYDALNPTQLELPETLDSLVYCPGSITLKPFHRLSEADLVDEFRLNALGAATTIQQALPSLKKSGQASILLFSTVAVQTGMNFHASIAMAKGAIEGLTRSLAAEFAPHIRVNAIAPSLNHTPLASALVNNEAKQKAASERHPLKAIGDPADTAALATFLLSPQAKWITGQILHADGGLSSLRPL